jgi:hypothetical protein
MADNEPIQKSKTPMVIISVTICITAALIFLNREWLIKFITQENSPVGQPGWEQKITSLEEEIAAKSPAEQEAQKSWQQAAEQIPPPSAQMQEPPSEEQIVQNKMLAFFNYIDQQDYFQEYHVEEGSQMHFRHVLDKLLANPPIVTREADDLFSILNNMAHFYRVLGGQELILIKDVLDHEADDLEEIMDTFYRWSEVNQEAGDDNLPFPLPLPGLYEYAGFFINTLGGQAYLFRRSQSVRLLVRYYAVLIIDRANQLNMNRHGIDIRRTIDTVIDELSAANGLSGRDTYLQRLTALQQRYQAKYE